MRPSLMRWQEDQEIGVSGGLSNGIQREMWGGGGGGLVL